MTLESISVALKGFLERQKAHHVHHYKKHKLKHHTKKKKKTHHARYHKQHQNVVNIYNGVAEALSKSQGQRPTPNPPATAQGVTMDIPYANLVNQRRVYERRFAELEKEKREEDAKSRFKEQYDAEEGEQDFRPEKKKTRRIVVKRKEKKVKTEDVEDPIVPPPPNAPRREAPLTAPPTEPTISPTMDRQARRQGVLRDSTGGGL